MGVLSLEDLLEAPYALPVTGHIASAIPEACGAPRMVSKDAAEACAVPWVLPAVLGAHGIGGGPGDVRSFADPLSPAVAAKFMQPPFEASEVVHRNFTQGLGVPRAAAYANVPPFGTLAAWFAFETLRCRLVELHGAASARQ